MSVTDLADRVASLSAEQREWLERRLRAKKMDAIGGGLERRPDEAERLPSSAQQGLWFLQQLNPEGAVYNITGALELAGEFDLTAMRRSLQHLVTRHEMLRTRLRSSEGLPRMQVADHLEARLPLVDLETVSDVRTVLADAEIERLMIDESRRGFDLEAWPLFRGLVVRRNARLHLVIFTMHHIISDAGSLELFIRQLSELYGTCAGGRLPTSEPLTYQYSDYAWWQNKRQLEGHRLSELLSYWKGALAEIPATLDLPADHATPALPSSQGSQCHLDLCEESRQRLTDLGRSRGATLFMTLLAVFKVLLHRITGQTDLLVGTPVSRRDHREFEDLLGLFVDTLVLRTDLAGDPSFHELLDRVRETSLKAFDHQELPFEKLVEELQPDREAGRHPLVQVMFNFQRDPLDALSLSGLRLRRLTLPTTTVKFDLELSVTQRPSGLVALMDTRDDIFLPSSGQRLLRHFFCLVESALTSPERRLSELSLMNDAERHQLAVEWNDTARQALEASHFLAILARMAVDRADSIAAIDSAGQLSYAELERGSGLLARHLRSRPLLSGRLGSEVPVAVLASRGTGLLTAMLAIWKAGGVYLPLDPLHPAGRHRAILERSGSPLVLCDAEFRDDLSGAIEAFSSDRRPTVLTLDLLTLDLLTLDLPTLDLPTLDRTALLDSIPAADQEPPRAELAYVIFTSGSTGLPKGAMVEHRGMINHLWAKVEDLKLHSNDQVVQNASQCFDISVWQMLAPLMRGGITWIFDDQVARDPLLLLDATLRYRITGLEIVPSMLEILTEDLLLRDAHDRPQLVALRWLMATGEALPPEVARRWLRLYPQIPLFNAYGPTECSDDVTHAVLHSPPGPKATRVRIGAPLREIILHVVDHRLRLVSLAQPGELCVGGISVGRGYLHDPGRTAEVFVPDPLTEEPGGRLYRTGDLVRWQADGELDFLGRLTHQVKVRGYRIELGEIEASLDRHSGVRQAIVLNRDDLPGGTGLVAYVVPGVVPHPSEEELREHLGQHLPPYMIPAHLLFLETLPTNSNGKIDRKVLLASEISAGIKTTDDALFEAPRGLQEEALAEVWSELLGLDAVGRHQDFFQLGGHSLLATQLLSRVRQRFAAQVSLLDFFAEPTVAGLSARLATDKPQRDEGIESIPRLDLVAEDGSPLSFTQQRLWFLHQLDPDEAAYNVPVVARLSGTLDPRRLRASIASVVERHETLRTVFPEGDSPFQVVQDEARFPFLTVDFSALPAAERQASARHRAAIEARRPFDLASGPLLRCVLMRLAEDEHLVLVNVHNIVADGWSMGVFLRDLVAFYRGDALPELPIRYVDFVHWQQRWAEGEAYRRQLAYWRQQLAEPPTALDLPFDFPRPPVASSEGERLDLRFDADLSRDLKRLAQRLDGTLYVLLMAAFQALLGRLSGQRDVAVGSPIASRNRRELEDLIGSFVNTLVIRAQMSSGETFQTWFQKLRQASYEAFEHQDLPFEKLVDEIQPERDLSHQPLFQVMFVLQNLPVESFELPGLRLEPVSLHNGTAKLDLSLSLEEAPEGLLGSLEYRTDLFESATIERLVGAYQRVLRQIVENPERPLATLELLSQGQQEQLREWGEGTPASSPELLHQLFERQSRKQHDALAICQDGEFLSYGELDRRSNHLAWELRQRNVMPGAIVGICLPRGVDLIVSMLGVLKAGAAYLPLDPAYPRERLEYMLADSGTKWLVRNSATAAALSGQSLDLDDLAWESCDEGPPICNAHPEDLCYLIYTSGSTGRPKGVAVVHRASAAFLHAMEDVFASRELARVLASTSISFDVSFFEIFAPLSHGGTVILLPSALELPDMPVDEIRRSTLFSTVPSILRELLRLGARLPSAVVVAGETLTSDLAQELFHHSKVKRLVNAYGPSETTTYSTATTIYSTATTIEPSSGAPPIGQPIRGTRIRLLDTALSPVLPGGLGEIFIAGAGVVRGYHGLPSRTAESFLPDPWSEIPGERLYRTGDLARYRLNGQLLFLGRRDHQVKVHGHRIELGEVEDALERLPEVSQAVVVVRQGRLTAYVVEQDVEHGVEHGVEQDVKQGLNGQADLTRHLGKQLRHWLPEPMVPTAWQFLTELPRTPSGKLDRAALPDPELGAKVEYVAPRTDLERTLARIWCEVLNLEQIGVNDNFFALGGDSIRGIQVITRARRAGFSPSPRDLFQCQTVAELARRLTGETDAITSSRRTRPFEVHELEAGALQRLKQDPSVEDVYPLTPLQDYLLHKAQEDPRPGLYRVVTARLVKGFRIDADAFRNAWQQVIDRHPALRTAFLWQGVRTPHQVVHRDVSLQLDLRDWRHCQNWRTELWPDFLDALQRQPMELEIPGQTRVALIRVGEEEQIFVWSFNHLLQEGWSFSLILRDLLDFYAGGAVEPRPTSACTLRDYVAWCQDQDLKQAEGFWRRYLAGFREPTSIIDPPERIDGAGTGRVRLQLDSNITAHLENFARQHRLTLNTLTQAAWCLSLAARTGQRDVVFGVVVSGRSPEIEGVEELVGSTLNMLPLRLTVPDSLPVLSWLREIHARQAELGEYEATPWRRIEGWSEVDDQLLAQSYLVFENFPFEASVREQVARWDTELLGAKLSWVELPLRVEVEPGANLTLTFDYDGRFLSHATVAELLEGFRSRLIRLAERPDQPVAEFL